VICERCVEAEKMTRFTIEFTPCQESENPMDVLQHNAREVDQLCDVAAMASIGNVWFKLNRGNNFRHLEEWFRSLNLNTHIFASRNRLEGAILKIPFSKTKKELRYEAWYSCRPPPFAKQEVHQHWLTMNGNLHALEWAGSHCFKEDERIEFDEILVPLNPHQMSLSQIISSNKFRISVLKEELSNPHLEQSLSETALSETALSETALSETALSETPLSETA
jgi:hypothetical protein